MKKILLAFTATSVLLISICIKAQAQLQDDVATTKTGKKSNDAFTSSSTASVTSTMSAKASKMAERAFKDFRKSFKNVSSADWTVTAEGGLVASFNENEVKNNVYYSNRGQWLYSIKRYDETQLPQDIRHMVRSTYYDYKIICAEEITAAAASDQTIFLVHIQFGNSSKTLRIADGEMDVIENLVN